MGGGGKREREREASLEAFPFPPPSFFSFFLGGGGEGKGEREGEMSNGPSARKEKSRFQPPPKFVSLKESIVSSSSSSPLPEVRSSKEEEEWRENVNRARDFAAPPSSASRSCEVSVLVVQFVAMSTHTQRSISQVLYKGKRNSGIVKANRL